MSTSSQVTTPSTKNHWYFITNCAFWSSVAVFGSSISGSFGLELNTTLQLQCRPLPKFQNIIDLTGA